MSFEEDRSYRLTMARAVATRFIATYKLVPPIDVERFCIEVAGLHVYYDEMEDEFCAILRRDLMAILVNQKHPRVRQRFSIAHELGHWYLHRDEAVMAERTATLKTINKLLDEEANSFAAEFLMPSRFVRAQVRLGMVNLDTLARYFEVSREAMWYQLNHLRLASKISSM
ncbi:MAG: ImmA/IrrE family metallo-endopeptidase [Bacillota bacterium]|jgi:Zn-dependent peptidase ImmA (M78 family)